MLCIPHRQQKPPPQNESKKKFINICFYVNSVFFSWKNRKAKIAINKMLKKIEIPNEYLPSCAFFFADSFEAVRTLSSFPPADFSFVFAFVFSSRSSFPFTNASELWSRAKESSPLLKRVFLSSLPEETRTTKVFWFDWAKNREKPILFWRISFLCTSVGEIVRIRLRRGIARMRNKKKSVVEKKKNWRCYLEKIFTIFVMWSERFNFRWSSSIWGWLGVKNMLRFWRSFLLRISSFSSSLSFSRILA